MDEIESKAVLSYLKKVPGLTVAERQFMIMVFVKNGGLQLDKEGWEEVEALYNYLQMKIENNTKWLDQKRAKD